MNLKPAEAAGEPRTDLRGVRLGVARNLAGFHPRVDALLERLGGVDGRLRVLDRLRTADGVEHAVELAEDDDARERPR